MLGSAYRALLHQPTLELAGTSFIEMLAAASIGALASFSCGADATHVRPACQGKPGEGDTTVNCRVRARPAGMFGDRSKIPTSSTIEACKHTAVGQGEGMHPAGGGEGAPV